MNIFCNAKGNVFYASAEKIYQGSIGVNEVCFIGEFPSSAQVLMAYRLPNGDYRPPIMLVRETTLDEVQDTRGGLWSVWKGRIGAVPKIEDGEMVKDENGNVIYDLDPTITEHYGTASLRFFVYGANGKIATEEVNFTIEKGLPIYLDINDLTTTTSAELLLEQILAVVNSLQTTDNGLRDDIEILRSELGVHVGVLTSDIAEVSKKVNDLSEQAVKATDKGVPNGVASLDGAGKIPQEQLPGSLDTNAYKWKLLGESEVTQAMVEQAGSEGITAVIVDLGSPVEQWYGETWIRIEMPNPKWDVDKPLNCSFGETVEAAMVGNPTDENCPIFSAQSPSYGIIFKGVKNEINIFTNWHENKPRGSTQQLTAFGAEDYPYYCFATSNTSDASIDGKRYLAVYARMSDGKFPVGTKLKLYGRFPE